MKNIQSIIDRISLNPKEAARNLKGMKVIIDSVEFYIIGTKSFKREENLKGIYKPMTEQFHPGTTKEVQPLDVYFPRFPNGILFLIVTKENGLTGACVLVQAIELNGVVYNGPAKTTQALGLTTPKLWGHMTVKNESTIELELDKPQTLPVIEQKVHRPRIATTNEITQVVIDDLREKLATAFLKSKTNQTFQAFINDMIEKCKTASALRSALR